MINSLHDAIALLEGAEELVRITVPVDTCRELPMVVRRISARPDGGKALLFEQPLGHQMPVVANLFGSTERMRLLLGLEQLEQLRERFETLLDRLPDYDLEQLGQRLDYLLRQDGFRPQMVEAAPCRELVDDAPDLLALPFHQNWPDDGSVAGTGRYITMGQIHTTAPDGSDQNCGIYRCQIHGPQTLAIRWRPGSGAARHHRQYCDLKQRMPVAISLGGPPALTLAAAWPLPDGLDELTFAGWLAGSPLPVVSCSHAPLAVPAGAELVLEGFAEPDQQLMEGPFGNHTGGYDPAGVAAKVTITRITRRRNPLLPITVVGPPPQEDCWMMLGWERLLAALLPRLVPGVVAIGMPLPWVFRQSAVIALDRARVDDLNILSQRLRQLPWFRSARLLLFVDQTTAPHDPLAVAWQSVNLADWNQHLLPGDDPLQLAVDATGWHRPGPSLADPLTSDLVSRRWAEYGLNDYIALKWDWYKGV